jgi:hypothetical protein
MTREIPGNIGEHSNQQEILALRVEIGHGYFGPY